MDKKQFATMVSNPGQFSSQDRGWLRAVQAKYPFSSVIGVLALMADHAFGYDTPTERRATALSMCNSHGMNDLLAASSQASEAQQVDILNEINTYQEVSFKTAPKSVILSEFLQAGPSSDIERATASEPHPAGDEKKSLRADDTLATETLAIILEKQGKPDKALAIYQKLLAANPEKNSIFAARIKELQQAINS